MPKITAIHSGCDWYDASADYVILPDGIDVQKEHECWNEWLAWRRYQFSLGNKVQFTSFVDWPMRCGAREPTEEELTIFDDM